MEVTPPKPPKNNKSNVPLTIKDGKPFTEDNKHGEELGKDFVIDNAYDAITGILEHKIGSLIDDLGDDLARGVGAAAKSNVSALLTVFGFGLDVHSMINDGVDGNKAFGMAIIHTAVGIAITTILSLWGSPSLALFLATMVISYLVNLKIDKLCGV